MSDAAIINRLTGTQFGQEVDNKGIDWEQEKVIQDTVLDLRFLGPGEYGDTESTVKAGMALAPDGFLLRTSERE